jgi:hypothetical protein
MDKIYCLAFFLLAVSASAQNYNSVYPKYNNTNNTVIIVEKKKQSLADVIAQQEQLNIQRKEQKKRQEQIQYQINQDYKLELENNKRKIAITNELRINKESLKSVANKLRFNSTGNGVYNKEKLDINNGFRDIKFETSRYNFKNLHLTDQGYYLYSSQNVNDFNIFGIKFDNIVLSFDNNDKLNVISLFKSYLFYDNSSIMKTGTNNFESIIEGVRNSLGRESRSKTIENSEVFIWEAKDVMLIIEGNINENVFTYDSYGNKIVPYYTLSVSYYKNSNLDQGI